MNSQFGISRRRFLASATAICGAGYSTHVLGFQQKGQSDSKRPRLIDCHLHFNHKGRSVADTIKHIDATGADKAFILPLETGEGGVVLTTDTVLEAFHKYPDRIIPFCQCDVRKPNVLERIRAYHKAGCQGFGEQKEHVPFGDPRIERVIALCDELNWPIVIHFQDGKNGYNQGLADHLETYLKRYKRVRILGHAQTWWAHISADVPPPEKTLYPKGPVKPGGVIDRLMTEYPNLYADLSAGSGYNALTRDEEFTAGFFERHRKQLLFATDCPCTDGRGGNFKGVCFSPRLKKLLRRTIRNEAALEDVFYNNAIRVLKGTS